MCPSPVLATRRFVAADGTEEGVWTYEPSHEPPSEPVGTCPDGTPDFTPELRQTVITSPLGDKTIQYFSCWPQQIASPNGISYEEYGLPFDRSQPDSSGTRFLSTVVQDCDSAGENCTDVRSTYVAYQFEGPCEFDNLCSDSNR